jgi:hypothetical protein
MRQLPSRDMIAVYPPVDFEEQQMILDAYASGELKTDAEHREAATPMVRSARGSSPAWYPASNAADVEEPDGWLSWKGRYRYD